MDADVVFRAEASSVVSNSYFVIAGQITEGQLRVGDRITKTEPATPIVGRRILGVEFISSTDGKKLGRCVAPDTDPDIESLRTTDFWGVRILISASNSEYPCSSA